jgi:hypothetical protein
MRGMELLSRMDYIAFLIGGGAMDIAFAISLLVLVASAAGVVWSLAPSLVRSFRNRPRIVGDGGRRVLKLIIDNTEYDIRLSEIEREDTRKIEAAIASARSHRLKALSA